MGVSRECPFFRVPPIISGTGKATNFKFCMHIYRLEQKPIKNFEKSSHGRSQGLPKSFRAPIHRAHRAVIFAIAQLSCWLIHPCDGQPKGQTDRRIDGRAIAYSALSTCCRALKSEYAECERLDAQRAERGIGSWGGSIGERCNGSGTEQHHRQFGLLQVATTYVV